MKFSTFSLSQVTEPSRTAEVLDEQFRLFLLAEELGYSTVWLAEHLFSTHGTFASTQVLAAAVARCTSTIRIGTAINVIAFNHPLRTASDFAAIDCISHGRLNYGVGRAYQAAEFEALGLDMRKSREIFSEALDIILKAWMGEPFTHEGEFWKIPKPVKVYPELIQRPYPPIYAAVQSRESFQTAGTRGFNILMSAGFAWHECGAAWVDNLEERLTAYEEAARAAGHDPGLLERALMISGYVGQTTTAAELVYAPRIDWALGQHAKRAQNDPSLPSLSPKSPQIADWNFRGLRAANACMVGDGQSVAEQIKEFTRRLGLHEVIVEFDRGGLRGSDIEAGMRLFMDEVPRRFAADTPSRAASEAGLHRAALGALRSRRP